LSCDCTRATGVSQWCRSHLVSSCACARCASDLVDGMAVRALRSLLLLWSIGLSLLVSSHAGWMDCPAGTFQDTQWVFASIMSAGSCNDICAVLPTTSAENEHCVQAELEFNTRNLKLKDKHIAQLEKENAELQRRIAALEREQQATDKQRHQAVGLNNVDLLPFVSSLLTRLCKVDCSNCFVIF